MKLTEFQEALSAMEGVNFTTPNGEAVPAHFHITEVGRVDKHFMDCGGTERRSTVISMQLWTANDIQHRLSAETLAGIIDLSKSKLGLPDVEVEVELQSDTIGRYGVEVKDGGFQMTSLHTDCLAIESCGIKAVATSPTIGKVIKAVSSCRPGSGCC